LCAGACTGADPQPGHRQIADPAARKCVADGYHLEPVRAADGLPIAHDCVEQSSGKRCDAWDYFRGDCRLRAVPSPSAKRG
jgi:putative hemolysin